MTKTIKLFEKEYRAEEMGDLGQDVMEAVDEDYNPLLKTLPVEDDFITCTFKVSIQYISEEVIDV